MKRLSKIEAYAIKNNIPIMQEAGLEYMIELFKKNNYHTCLEIGSAIGYSALMMVKNIPDFQVETLEKDKLRYQEAIVYLQDYDRDGKVIIHHADALLFELEDLVLKKYDCLFIDAAKAQYQRFFLKYISCLKDNGVCVVDNLDFHDMIFDIENIKNRNTRQLVKKIKKFKEWIMNNSDYEVEYLKIGDGLVIIRKR